MNLEKGGGRVNNVQEWFTEESMSTDATKNVNSRATDDLMLLYQWGLLAVDFFLRDFKEKKSFNNSNLKKEYN